MDADTRGGRVEINSFGLKIIAIVAMTCNHVANTFGGTLPAGVDFILYSLGGVTFPIMAHMIVEGYSHTSSLRNYALRLLGFALISQIPFSLLWGATPNVMFTLLVGLGVLRADDVLESHGASLVILVFCVLLTSGFDWGGIGILVIYCFKQWKNDAHGATKTMVVLIAVLVISTIGSSAVPFETMLASDGSDSPSAEQATLYGAASATEALKGQTLENLKEFGYEIIGCGCAGILLCRYSGKRGRPLKWLFYIYYPAHLFIIWLIACCLY